MESNSVRHDIASDPIADISFDELAQLAAQICQTPIALISLTNQTHHWLKTQLGWLVQDAAAYLDFCALTLKHTDLCVIPNALLDARFDQNPLVVKQPELRFYAGIPLIDSRGQLRGTLSVMDRIGRSLSLEQIAALRMLARQVVAQLELQTLKASRATFNSVKPDQWAEVSRRLSCDPSTVPEFAKTIATILTQGGNLTQVLEQCMITITQLCNVPFVRLWVFNAKTNLLELQVAIGQPSPTDDFASRIPLGISIMGVIAQSQQPYLSQDVSRDLCIGAKSWVRQQELISFAGYPLLVEGRLLGVMAVFARQPLRETEQQTLSWISQNLALAIDRSWAREELLSRREAILFRLASQIRASLNLDLILNTTVQEIRTLLKIDRCHFLWCQIVGHNPDPANGKEKTLICEIPELMITHEAKEQNLPSLLGNGKGCDAALLLPKLLNLQMIRVQDSLNEAELEPEIQQSLVQAGIIAQLLVPLETRSNPVGAIVCSHSSPRIWSESEIELLQAVGDQVAIAIDQAELYAKTRAAAAAAEMQAKQLSEALHDLRQTQAHLIQTEKMSSLGQMVAGIAHEINNPVSFISGNVIYASNYIHDLLHLVQLYQQHYPDPVDEIQEVSEQIDVEFIGQDLPKLLSSMKIGSDRIREIVLSLRNFSRLDEAEMKPVNIHEGIDSTLLILENRLKASTNRVGIEVNKQYGDLPLVTCYAGQLNQVFMNILSNAIDALEDRIKDAPPDQFRPSIEIQTQFLRHSNPTQSTDLAALDQTIDQAIDSGSTDSNAIAHPKQGMAVVRVRDNGKGMDSATQTKLFDPFFTTKPVGRGTGLGMSISYQIVQKHRGVLHCQSQPGAGTEFIIQIPIV